MIRNIYKQSPSTTSKSWKEITKITDKKQLAIQKCNSLFAFIVSTFKRIDYFFDYACSFWYPGLSKFPRERLQVTQNKMVRFVLKPNPKSHVGSEEFKSLRLLPVTKRVDQVILNHIFRIRSGTSP